MKKIISLILALIMVLGMAVPAFAWSVQSIKVTGKYGAGAKLKSITASIDWNLDTAQCNLVLMEKCLTSPENEGGIGSYGDFTNIGTYKTTFPDTDDIMDDVIAYNSGYFGVISYTGKTELEYGSEDNKLTLNIGSGDLDTPGIYYIYLWTHYNGYFFPDNLVAAIKVADDGKVTCSHVLEGKRNTYDEDAFEAVEEEKYTFEYAYDCDRSITYPAKDQTVTLSGFDKPYVDDDSSIRVENKGPWTLTRVGKWSELDESLKSISNLSDIVEGVAGGYNTDSDPVSKDDIAVYKLEVGNYDIYGVLIANDGKGHALFLGDTVDTHTGGTGFLLSNEEITDNDFDMLVSTDATDEDPMDVPSVPSVPTYTVIFVDCGETVSVQTVEDIAELAVPEEKGKLFYKFEGWYDEEGYKLDENYELTGDPIFTAKYSFRQTYNRPSDVVEEKPEDVAEANPSTGAPVFAPAVIVLSAAAAFLGKRK